MILWLSMVLANENWRIVKSETECSEWSLSSRLSSDKHQNGRGNSADNSSRSTKFIDHLTEYNDDRNEEFDIKRDRKD